MSAPAPVYANEQSYDLRVKSTKQLGTQDQIAWSSGNASGALGVTFPGGTKEQVEISCGPKY